MAETSQDGNHMAQKLDAQVLLHKFRFYLLANTSAGKPQLGMLFGQILLDSSLQIDHNDRYNCLDQYPIYLSGFWISHQRSHSTKVVKYPEKM
mmetsp:Transcript_1802/g.1876  ORF Transcript_1802/g.1876 Transcript_1802/m.1876 type:complete len:93 (+) Transcript_1802:35-313(+)